MLQSDWTYIDPDMATGDMLGLYIFLFSFNSTHWGNFTDFTEWTMNANAVCQISNKVIWQDQKH